MDLLIYLIYLLLKTDINRMAQSHFGDQHQFSLYERIASECQ